MSRIGKLPIIILQGVTVDMQDRNLKIAGPKGVLEYEYAPSLTVTKSGDEIKIELKEDTNQSRALWGLTRTLINNMVEGVSKGFEKQLEIIGIGYRAAMQGNKLVVSAGYSHPVDVLPPAGINLRVEKNVITVSGFDKQLVGAVAAKIRQIRKPEPYKGKGIRYSGEFIKRKAGKAAKAR